VTFLQLLDGLLDALGQCEARTLCEHGAELRCELAAGHPGDHIATSKWQRCAREWPTTH
jgi:hypothetical protein